MNASSRIIGALALLLGICAGASAQGSRGPQGGSAAPQPGAAPQTPGISGTASGAAGPNPTEQSGAGSTSGGQGGTQSQPVLPLINTSPSSPQLYGPGDTVRHGGERRRRPARTTQPSLRGGAQPGGATGGAINGTATQP